MISITIIMVLRFSLAPYFILMAIFGRIGGLMIIRGMGIPRPVIRITRDTIITEMATTTEANILVLTVTTEANIRALTVLLRQ